ncbi:hypothetical protein [Bacillus sp. FJAT-42315]|uniref:hypothetical protein n=1 Tax=Bacillus sp. FJAT-42315 TaxID=2014077 RepID=UPI000C23C48F|nr:hypothetical protein [Bacillus sp. FJAT-42315]
MFEVIEVNHTNFLSFQRFLLPGHFQQLQSADSTVWGLGAVSEGVPVGILLTKLDIHLKTASIVHFLVRDYQHSIAALEQLLNTAEQLLAKKGFTCIDATVTVDEEIEVISDLFAKKGWCTNPQIVNKYIMDMKKMQNNDWVWGLETPAHLNIVHWTPVIEKEFKQRILNQEIGDPVIIPYLKDLHKIDGEYSFVLYASGELAGWCICEKIAQNMVLSINSYVKKSAATRLGGMLLYAELVKKALEHNTYITFFTHKNNKNMQNIIRRRFKESTIHKTTLIQFKRDTGTGSLSQ